MIGPTPFPLRHLVLSYHTCPTERPGRDLAGGMNVLLLGFLRHTTWPTDLVTRSFGGYERCEIKPGVVVHRLPCGASRPWTRELAHHCLPRFRESFQDWLNGRVFDVASAHYWMSGELLELLDCPAGMLFHTLQAQKGSPRDALERERLSVERRLAGNYPSAFLHWHDLRHARERMACLRGRVVRPGHDWEIAEQPREPNLPKVFGWAARRDAIKNFERATTLLETAREANREARLRVAGMEGEAEAGIEYLGQLDTESMRHFYSEIDQLWNFSHYETFGLSVLEALTQGATVGLNPDCDWFARLSRLGINATPGRNWSARERNAALTLSRAYRWERALPSWERWLSRLSLL